MSLSAGLLLGILAMLGWGVHKIFAKKLIDRAGPYSGFVYGNIFLVALIAAYCIVTGTFAVPSFNIFVFTIILALLGTIGALSLYKAMHIGKVSIVVPISHVYAAVVVVIGFIFFGERLTGLQFTAVSFAVIGTILVSFRISGLKKLKLSQASKGIPYALVTMVSWGIYASMLKIVVKEIGVFVTALYFESIVLAAVLIPLVFGAAKLKKINKDGMKIAALVGLAGAVAALAYNAALSMELVSIVGPVSACALMVTVVLSRIFLGERIELNQKIAVLMIFAGILMLALA